MAGATKRIEEASKALGEGMVKKAMLLTDSSRTAREHAVVVGIAKQCVANKEECAKYCREGAAQLKDRITATTDTNEGLEEMLQEEEQKGLPPEDKVKVKLAPEPEKTDDELLADCEECNVAGAAASFVRIAEKDECDGETAMDALQPCLDNELTTPETWLKTMTKVAEQATCNKQKYGEVLGGLTDYLQKRDSPILKNLDKGA